MSFRMWVTIITVLLLAGTVYFGWSEIVDAWNLLGQVNLWILSLLIPIQLLSYYATGGLMFSYLRSKGELKTANRWQMTRMTLELNFVNHILPSGGAVGFTYLGWVLSRFGVKAGRATMAQIIRFGVTFATFLLLLVASVVWLAIDHQVDRTVYIMCSILAVMSIAAVGAIIYIISGRKRLVKFSGLLNRFFNKITKFFTRGRKTELFEDGVIEKFFEELHDDYEAIKKDKKILFKPFLWGVWAHVSDVLLFVVAFWALGLWVNPAVIFIAMGLAAIAAVLSVIPAGAGASEAVMITFYVTAGVPLDVALAGTLLARVILVMGTIIFGYFFYQHTMNTYGKTPVQRK
jgi:uncharacterized protein (TIRG00374 family)